MLVAYNKTNIPCLYLLDIKIIHPRQYNIQLRLVSLNINYFGWIISDIKQKDMEYLLTIITIIFLFYIINFNLIKIHE